MTFWEAATTIVAQKFQAKASKMNSFSLVVAQPSFELFVDVVQALNYVPSSVNMLHDVGECRSSEILPTASMIDMENVRAIKRSQIRIVCRQVQ